MKITDAASLQLGVKVVADASIALRVGMTIAGAEQRMMRWHLVRADEVPRRL